MFDVKNEDPSLCAYCKAPARGFLYIDKPKAYGACSMDHLAKIMEKEFLKNVARINMKGLRYAIKQTKEIYLKLSREEKTFTIHDWDKKNREQLFEKVVREYLNHANHQAETGESNFGETD